MLFASSCSMGECSSSKKCTTTNHRPLSFLITYLTKCYKNALKEGFCHVLRCLGKHLQIGVLGEKDNLKTV